MIFSNEDRYMILTADKEPVRLYWNTAPLAADDRGERPVARFCWHDFGNRSNAVKYAATLWGRPDFCEPYLTDADGRRLTYGGEFTAYIIHHFDAQTSAG
jgi:hypothetical protein